jgi:transposase
MGLKRRQFSREFKEEAVELASRPDVTIKDVAHDLGIHRSVLERWCRASNTAGKEAFPGKGQPRDEEVAQLRRELTRVKKERDFLRDAFCAMRQRSSPGSHPAVPGDPALSR